MHNQAWSESKGPEAVGLDCAPRFVAGFGAIYDGASIAVTKLLAAFDWLSATDFAWLIPAMLVVSIVFPV